MACAATGSALTEPNPGRGQCQRGVRDVMVDPASHLGDRYTGCLLGLAAGDALGTALEFSRPGSFPPLTDMVGGGPFRLAAGEWTDDTSMALCLAESLVECRGFDAVDQLRRHVRWWREGYLSSTGRCFDIGFTTRRALQRFERTGEPWCGSTDDRSAGNGSLMRLAPVALFYARRPAEAVERAADSSRTTHGARDAVDACRYFSSLLVGALAGVPKADLVSARLEPATALWGSQPLSPAVAEALLHHRAPGDRGDGANPR